MPLKSNKSSGGRKLAPRRLTLPSKLERRKSLMDYEDDDIGCNYSPSPVKMLAPPIKPPCDPKSYRTLQLANGARVILISEIPVGGRREQNAKISLPYISDCTVNERFEL